MAAKRQTRRLWTKADERKLRDHSRQHTPTRAAAKDMKRTERAVHQKAWTLNLPLGAFQRRRQAR